MYNYNFIWAFALLLTTAYSQEKDCNCMTALNEVSEVIKSSKSYKDQVTTANLRIELQEWREQIKEEIKNDSLSTFFCVGYIQKYISFIKDRHNEIYWIPEDIPVNISSYSKNIDTTLTASDSISGIYFAGSDKILVKKSAEDEWLGITLNSNSKAWTKGKIRLRIKKTSPKTFEIFEFYKNGLLFYQNTISISEGRIHSTFWNKEDNYFFNKNHAENFNYISLNPSFDYVGIKTLSRTKALMKEADKFYDETLQKLEKENLIIDLRNNSGGSLKQAKPLIKYVKRNSSLKTIYVVINFKTSSAAELAVLELLEDNRTKLVGENSRGMLAYGYGNKAYKTTTSCMDYNITLSTKHNNKAFAQYETKGLTPDVKLSNTTSWIEQIINIEEN